MAIRKQSKVTREQKLGITADRFTDHQKYYEQLAKAVGIRWHVSASKFLGHDIEYWSKKYVEDKHLNNHPLADFDNCYAWHRVNYAPVAGSWSLCDTVCCLKAVIRQRVLEAKK